MKITALRCVLVSAPYATPGDAEREYHLKQGYRPASFVVIETDEGLDGVGETYAGVYAPEAVQALVKQLAADLIGQDARDISAVWDRARLATYYWGRMGLSQSVIGGIEMALWDLKGKALGQPVYALLGGKMHDAIPVYASGGNDKPFPDLERELRGYVATGSGRSRSGSTTCRQRRSWRRWPSAGRCWVPTLGWRSTPRRDWRRRPGR